MTISHPERTALTSEQIVPSKNLVQSKPHIEGRLQEQRGNVHPLQARILRINLGYSLTVFFMLAVPMFTPLMQALDDPSLSWQERAVFANELLNLHSRYWPWALGAGLVLIIQCVHSMLALARVAEPLYRLKTVCQQIGQGNLAIRMTPRDRDFRTRETEHVNQMTAQLLAKISAIKAATATVSFGVGQLQHVVTNTGNPILGELMRNTERDLAGLKASLDSFKTDKE